jgi:hypothetical protein
VNQMNGPDASETNVGRGILKRVMMRAMMIVNNRRRRG